MSSATKSRVLLAVIALFLASGLAMLTAFNSQKPRIVIVHPLSKESTWAEAIDRGARSVLSANRIPLSVSFDYLGLDIVSERADQSALVSSLLQRIQSVDPDVLILVDDESSELVGRHYLKGPRPAVIYTGLLGDPANYGYTGRQHIAGIRERLPLEAIVAVLGQAHGNRPLDLAILGTANLTGEAEMRQVQAYDWGPHRVIARQAVAHFEDWKAFVLGPAKRADALIVLSMDFLPASAISGRSVPEAQVVAWTERSATPLVIGVRQSYVRLGGALSVSSPPVEFGALAVKLALRRLSDPDALSDSQGLSTDSFDVSIRLSALARRGVSLPRIYQEAARGAGLLYP